MNEKSFASTEDTAEKKVAFDQIGSGLYAYTADGDPNSGIIVGDDGVMVVDAQATPAMADDVIARVAKVTDKPIKYVLLTHYHAVRVLGASAYKGAEILASDTTRGLIAEPASRTWSPRSDASRACSARWKAFPA
jgi:glyoxylase-like metal-dependent hydrolase (beta-lactamase superfamily II)